MTVPLRIVSWNIRKAVGLDWRRDPARVLRVLTRVRADIVLLQEADRRLPPRPPALPPALVHAAGWTMPDADPATPSIGHHGNAILLGPGLSVTELDAVDLPGLEPRGAVLARVAGRGMAWTIGALHLGLRRADRLLQMAVVLEAAERMGGPAILGGDLNEWRGARGLLAPTARWQEFVPGSSFHADIPRWPLDRFMVSSDLEVRGHGVVPAADAERASDHLPVWIEAVTKSPAAAR